MINQERQFLVSLVGGLIDGMRVETLISFKFNGLIMRLFIQYVDQTIIADHDHATNQISDVHCPLTAI